MSLKPVPLAASCVRYPSAFAASYLQLIVEKAVEWLLPNMLNSLLPLRLLRLRTVIVVARTIFTVSSELSRHSTTSILLFFGGLVTAVRALVGMQCMMVARD